MVQMGLVLETVKPGHNLDLTNAESMNYELVLNARSQMAISTSGSGQELRLLRCVNALLLYLLMADRKKR